MVGPSELDSEALARSLLAEACPFKSDKNVRGIGQRPHHEWMQEFVTLWKVSWGGANSCYAIGRFVHPRREVIDCVHRR
jgi:hypothetical protein